MGGFRRWDPYDNADPEYHIRQLERELEQLERGAERSEDRLIKELNAAKDRIRELEAALRRLVELKDGPRDETYEQAKPAAWSAARACLGGQP